MIYVDNDFYSNFNSIKKSNDDVSMSSLFIDQLSNIIAYKKDELIDLFKKVDIAINDKPTNKQLTDAIVSNLATNKKLVIGLSYLIAKDNDILQEQLKKSRTNDSFSNVDAKKKKVDWSKAQDSIQVIAGSMSSVADSLVGVKKGMFSDDLLGQANAKDKTSITDELNKQQDKKNNKWIWLVLGVVVVGGIGYYGYKKGWFSKQSTPDMNV